MDRISVNSISSKFNKKVKLAEKLLYLSFGLVFFCYPINLLIGDGDLYKVIAFLIIGNMFFWGAYYYIIDKFETIGQIVFDKDQITIKERAEIENFKIEAISYLTISYYGYANEPYLTFYRPFLHNSNGHDNTLILDSSDKSSQYKFSILNKSQRRLLKQKIAEYKNLGVKIKLVDKEKFIDI